MSDAFGRTRVLFGDAAMDKLMHARVLVLGAGGVGGYALEILARSGVGQIDVVDGDVFEPSNLNRQILATAETLGKNKADVAAARLKSIHSNIVTRAFPIFYLPDTAHEIRLDGYDLCVDAIDSLIGKAQLAADCKAAGLPLLSCMGTGNRLDPTAFRVGDIFSVTGCPLAAKLRKALRDRGIERLTCIYSTEPPQKTGLRTPQSTPFCPAAAGILLGSEAVKALLSNKE